jgi:hypothetical protein
MTEQHPSNGHQTVTALLSRTRPVFEASERRLIVREGEDGACLKRSSDVNWEMLAIWGFVVLSFAAMLFCIFIIFAKCHNDWPY